MYMRPIVPVEEKDYYDDDIDCSWPCVSAVLLVFLFFVLIIFVIFFSVYLAEVNAERAEAAADDRKGGTMFIEMRSTNLNSRAKMLFQPSVYRRHLKRRPSLNVDRSLSIIHGAINKFITKCENAKNSTEGLPFRYVPDSLGIATTCRLNALCVTSLLFLHNQTNGTIPVELWLERNSADFAMLNRIQDEMGGSLIVRFFDEINTTFVNFFGEKIPFYKNNFALKTLVMVGSSFQHLIWMDGDVMFIRDPRVMLENPQMNTSGMGLWRDMACIDINNPIWRMMQTEARSGVGGESGVVYINKEVAWEALYLAAFMNQNQHVFYRVLYGDKDTFFLAAERLKLPYYMLPYNPVPIGDEKKLYSFLQPAPDGAPFFVHLAGAAKEDFEDCIKEGKLPFSRIVNYDPERSHMDYADGHFFRVVSDRRTYDVPKPVSLNLYIDNSTLNSFGTVYKHAKELVNSS